MRFIPYTLILIIALVVLAGCSHNSQPSPSTGPVAQPAHSASPVAQAAPSGKISASPNPVPAGSGNGATTVSWEVASGGAGQIFVSTDGKTEALFAASGKGSKSAPWIAAGHTYEFRLYKGVEHSTIIASTTVTRLPK